MSVTILESNTQNDDCLRSILEVYWNGCRFRKEVQQLDDRRTLILRTLWRRSSMQPSYVSYCIVSKYREERETQTVTVPDIRKSANWVVGISLRRWRWHYISSISYGWVERVLMWRRMTIRARRCRKERIVPKTVSFSENSLVVLPPALCTIGSVSFTMGIQKE